MGLVVIVILLIGVMGAGLLVFVRNDLEAVVAVNQGQKAFDIADSGLQVAKRQLQGNKLPDYYDVDTSSDPDYAAGCGVEDESADSEWSLEGEAGEEGVTRDFAGGRFTVTIQWLARDLPDGSPCGAPEMDQDPAAGVDYFRVVSTGYFPRDGTGAKRKIEAIYGTYDLDVPRSFYTPDDIAVTNTANVENTSLFSRGDVTVGNGATIGGRDLAYGNWKDTINPTARSTEAAGIGALGTITGSSRRGERDFDGGTNPAMVMPSRLDGPGGSSDKITFPFDPGQQPDLDLLRELAKAQNNYYEVSTGSTDVGDGPGAGVEWPDNSSVNTVVFVEYTGSGTHEVSWDAGSSCEEDPRKGVLVVNNGNFNISENTAPLEGVAIVRGGSAAVGTATAAGGGACLAGFVHATGRIELSGDVSLSPLDGAYEHPGFYGVRQWSWRECYSESCEEDIGSSAEGSFSGVARLPALLPFGSAGGAPLLARAPGAASGTLE